MATSTTTKVKTYGIFALKVLVIIWALNHKNTVSQKVKAVIG